jgi:hypothetical protein
VSGATRLLAKKINPMDSASDAFAGMERIPFECFSPGGDRSSSKLSFKPDALLTKARTKRSFMDVFILTEKSNE